MPFVSSSDRALLAPSPHPNTLPTHTHNVVALVLQGCQRAAVRQNMELPLEYPTHGHTQSKSGKHERGHHGSRLEEVRVIAHLARTRSR